MASVACLAYKNGKVFVAKRNPAGQMGGRWEFPGGKIDEGETCEKAVVREMQEEFGVCVRVGERICEGEFFHGGKKNSLFAYEIFFEDCEADAHFNLTEHTECKWILLCDIKKIPKKDFVDSDLAIYEKVEEFFKKKYG